jgi:hypothetical protein
MYFDSFDDDDEFEDDDYFGYAFSELEEDDGIIDGDLYWSDENYQVMWVLKEPYFKNGLIPIRDILGYRPVNNTTLKRVAYTTYGIHNYMYYDDMPDINEDDDVADELQSIAYVNVNKSGGGTTSKYHSLKRAYNENRYLLLGQIQAYEPEIIIFGGTFSLFWEDLIEELGLELQKLDFYDDIDCDCYIDSSDDSVLYVEAEHPGIRSSSSDYVDTIVSAVRAWEDDEYTVLNEW